MQLIENNEESKVVVVFIFFKLSLMTNFGAGEGLQKTGSGFLHNCKALW